MKGNKPATEMTQREWLAGQALQGVLASNVVSLGETVSRNVAAKHAVEMADAVLEALDHKGRVAHSADCAVSLNGRHACSCGAE